MTLNQSDVPETNELIDAQRFKSFLPKLLAYIERTCRRYSKKSDIHTDILYEYDESNKKEIIGCEEYVVEFIYKKDDDRRLKKPRNILIKSNIFISDKPIYHEIYNLSSFIHNLFDIIEDCLSCNMPSDDDCERIFDELGASSFNDIRRMFYNHVIGSGVFEILDVLYQSYVKINYPKQMEFLTSEEAPAICLDFHGFIYDVLGIENNICSYVNELCRKYNKTNEQYLLKIIKAVIYASIPIETGMLLGVNPVY